MADEQKTRVVRLGEQTVIDIVANQDLKSVDIVYDEVKRTFDAQQKRIDTLTSRATWLVATAFGIVVAVTGRTGDLAKLHLPDVAIWALVGGSALAVLAAALSVSAARFHTYMEGITIQSLQEDFLWWDPVNTKSTLGNIGEWL